MKLDLKKNQNQRKKNCFRQLEKAFQILLQIKHLGVKEFCLCPGSRNAPFTYLLSHSHLYKKVYPCFEERSAAFFALGRIRRTKLPVAIVTTSGTAVGELLPATMEAYYLGLPLILLTADRPKSYRGSGAPQTVEQKNIFSNYVFKKIDLEKNSNFNFKKKINPIAPIHINVCFDEPLGDFSPKEIHEIVKGFLKKQTKKEKLSKEKQKKENKKLSRFNFESPSTSVSNFQTIKKNIKNFLKKHKRPLILVSEIEEKNKFILKKFLNQLSCPFYLEPLSGLREDEKLSKQALTSWEKIFKTEIFHQTIDSVLRIGGVPTLRFWRDLEQKYSYPVLNVSHLPFKGLSRLNSSPLSLETFCLLINQDISFIKETFKPLFSEKSNKKNIQLFFKKDRNIKKKIDALLKKFPFSEPSLISIFPLIAKSNSFIFLGNSLPIREWDLASNRKKNFFYGSQKGVNGIDGLISNFLGFCNQKKENWCFVGDLSTLYDLNALWLLKHRSKATIRIVIINNGGGRIFSRNFKNSHFFENRHKIHFLNWAKMFSCEYIKISSELQTLKKAQSFISSKLKKFHTSPVIIEVFPSEKETLHFWKSLEKI